MHRANTHHLEFSALHGSDNNVDICSVRNLHCLAQARLPVVHRCSALLTPLLCQLSSSGSDFLLYSDAVGQIRLSMAMLLAVEIPLLDIAFRWEFSNLNDSQVGIFHSNEIRKILSADYATTTLHAIDNIIQPRS
jgi:hypothetical protein